MLLRQLATSNVCAFTLVRGQLGAYEVAGDWGKRAPDGPIQLLPKARKLKVALAFIMAIAFGIRILWAFSAPPQRFDEYAEIAENLSNNHGYAWTIGGKLVPTDIRAPIYPLLLSACYRVGHSFEPAILLQIALSTASCYLAFVLGASLFSSEAGLICSALSALDFFQIIMTRFLMTETLFIFLILSGQILLLRVLRSDTSKLRLGFCISYSAIMSAAILTRPETLAYFSLLLVYLVYALRRESRICLIRVSLVLCVTVCLVIPWMIRNYIVLGDFEVSNGVLLDFNFYRGLSEVKGNSSNDFGFEFYRGIRSGKIPINPSASRKTIHQQIVNKWEEIIVNRPRTVLIERVRNLSRALLYKGEFYLADPMSLKQGVATHQWRRVVEKAGLVGVFGILPWFLAIWGAVCVRTKRIANEMVTLWLFPVCVIILMIPLWADPRYMLPAHILLAPLVAVALLTIRTKMQSIYSRIR